MTGGRAALDAAAAGVTLDMAGVSKRFGGLIALSDVSMSIATGRIHGLIGPNGAGKSTTIAMLSGFARPDTGRITFGGRDVLRLSPSAIARLGLGRTFQQATPLAGLSVLENVLVGMHTRFGAGLGSVLLRLPAMRREAKTLGAAVTDLLALFDLDGQAEADAANLTFGQLRFLEIARTIAMRPKILLLDEPAAGLNQAETEKLALLLRRFRDAGMGVLLVDHDVPFVFSLCEEITMMNFGAILAAGTPDEMYRNPQVREAYLGNDAELREATQ